MTTAMPTTVTDATLTDVAGSRVRAIIMRLLASITFLVLVLADALAFNQLATQSPTDGIIQLSVVGVGFGGMLTALTMLVAARPRVLLALAPIVGAVAALTLIGWRAQWPIGTAVVACGISAITWGVVASVGRGPDGRPPSRFVTSVAIAQAVIALWFAVLVGIDAHAVLFG